MHVLRTKNLNNPFFAYYNINSLRYKFDDLKEILSKTPPDILVLAETKIDHTFPNAQFYLEEYYEPTRSDNSCHSGGIIEYIRKGIIRKRLNDFELKSFENIASELTINKVKYFLLSFYRTERKESKIANIKRFFDELSPILNKATSKYDNIILMGDINIDFKDTNSIGNRELKDFMNVFGLQNVIKDNTCFFRDNESSIDVILTNTPRKLFHSNTFELGISDCHKMVGTYLRVHMSRLKSKKITYRSLKNFDSEAFCLELGTKLKQISYENGNVAFDNLVSTYTDLLDRFAPLKCKTIRGNQSRFMNKSLSKAIMKRSALKSKYLKKKTSENRTNFKKQRNFCTKLRDQAIKNDFDEAFSDLNSNSKPFYDILKPYLTNKGALCNTDISLSENNNILSNDIEIANIFNEYYTNIVEHTSGNRPKNKADDLPTGSSFDIILDNITKTYEDHPSIKAIHNRKSDSQHTPFKFKPVKIKNVFNLLKSLDAKKAVGIDGIPPLILKISAKILAEPLTRIINICISDNVFPTLAKLASILPFFKKGDRSNKKNYRPVSVLSSLSKIFGKILQNQLIDFSNSFLSKYITSYRKGHSTEHVLIRLIEDWKAKLDNGFYVGAIMMDLSKAFDCISHDLLIAKMNAYKFDKSALKLIYSYLKGRRQCVKINSSSSNYQTIISGVPQGSILGPILFNIFINDLYFFFPNDNLFGFADDHSISNSSTSLEELKGKLSDDSKVAIDWLDNNQMIANPSKFQAIILNKSKDHILTDINIEGHNIKSSDLVTLLGIDIDDKINFDSHIGKLCTKTGGQLNCLYRFNKYLSVSAKKLAINSYIYSNFSYCPLVWHCSSTKSKNSIENMQKRALKLFDDSHSLGDFKPGKSSMEVKRLRSLAIEIYKTLNHLNPNYMFEIFKPSENRSSERLKHNIASQRFKQVKFGKNSIRVLGPKLWNSLPNQIKSLPTLEYFKNFMKTWGNKDCKYYDKYISYVQAI